MKKYIFILSFLFIGVKSYSQAVVPQSTGQESFQKAEFPGGDDAFRKEFLKKVYSSVDMALYAMQGEITFIFNIDPKGKIDKVDILPKFKNNEMFIDDMKYAVKKVKNKWQPATRNGIAVDSKFIMKVNFEHNLYDVD